MKLKIWGEKPEEKKPFWDGSVRLERIDNEIILVAVNEAGGKIHCGKLIGLTDEGRVRAYENINFKLGFQLDISDKNVSKIDWVEN